MIEIRTNSTELENRISVNIECKIDGNRQPLTKEILSILRVLEEHCPGPLLDAIMLHCKDIDEELKEGGYDD